MNNRVTPTIPTPTNPSTPRAPMPETAPVSDTVENFTRDFTQMIGSSLQEFLTRADRNCDGIVNAQDRNLPNGLASVQHLDLDIGKLQEGVTAQIGRLVAAHDLDHNGILDQPEIDALLAAYNRLAWNNAGFDGERMLQTAFGTNNPERRPLTTEKFLEHFSGIIDHGLPESARTPATGTTPQR